MHNREKLLRKCQRMQRSFYDLAVGGEGGGRGGGPPWLGISMKKNLFKEGRERIEVDSRLKGPV